MKSSIFNWMIEGYQRLRDNKWMITNASTIDEVKDIFCKSEYQINTFIVWLNECCIQDVLHRELKTDLCRHYLRWCNDRNLIPYAINIRQFGLQMKKQEPVRLKKTEAKPCPFCGHLPEIEPWHGGPTSKRMVSCANEDCMVSPAVCGKTKEKALGYWNIRYYEF